MQIKTPLTTYIKPNTNKKHKVTEESVDPNLKSNVASSTINHEIEQVFGLLEEDPNMRNIPLN